ncbi:hypothetical protein L0222_08835 [bacterium]|nr:hypothetical protein [bacterium]
MKRNERAFLALVLPDSQIRQKEFFRSVLAFPYVSGVIRLAEEKGDKLVLHVFLQASDQARFESWIVRTQEDQNQSRIRNCQAINAISGLYRLRMGDRPFIVRNLKYKHVDATIHFQQGHIFHIETGSKLAGIFFLGEASFEFDPPDPIERQQVNLFVKQPRVQTTATSIFIRSSPDTLEHMLEPLAKQTPDQNPGLYAKAQSESKNVERNVYSVRVPFSDELWFAQMEEGELYCEMKTALGTLQYQHSPGEADDILLAQKDKDQIISLYKSNPEKSADDSVNDFKIQSYKMKMRFQPTATHLSSVTEVKLKSAIDTTSIVFRLNPELRVSQIRSSQGYLIYFQEKQTNNLHLILNETLEKGKEILLEFYYQGKIAPEKRSSETMLLQTGSDDFYLPPTYLYSNQSLWYPQLASRPYSGVEASITVPENYAAIINGVRTGVDSTKGNVTFSYKCLLPAKYFSLFVGRLDSHLRHESIVPIDVYYLSLDKNAAKDYAAAADRMLRFYSGYFGTYPYQNLAIILRPVHQPGGHAPATVAIVNRVFKFFQRRFGRDPLHVPEYPHFLLAHEIAHQWWGQTVGWKTYHDQWLSEGFAQFAAWEYIRSQQGDAAWKRLADIFQEWVEEKSYAGPLILGARLGHIKDDPQAYSALLYNKGAFTLNMLKHWMGKENFLSCLKEFFEAYQFRRVGVEEFVLIAQKHSKEDLKPFFQQWLYRWDLPEIRWSSRTEVAGSDLELKVKIQQNQENLYQLRIPMQAKSKTGELFRFVASIEKQEEEVRVTLPFVPASLEMDPLHETLMKMSVPGK